MKSYVAAALFAGAAMAQSIADLPSCSLSCIVSGVQSVGCSVTDYSCACGQSAALSASVTPCVQSACTSADDQAKVITVLEGICAAAGITISISNPAATSAASAVASSAAAVATSAEASASAESSAVATAAGSSAPESSAAAYTTVAVSSYPSGAANGTGIVSATPYPTQYTGAASANGVTFGAAGALGLLAYLL